MRLTGETFQKFHYRPGLRCSVCALLTQQLRCTQTAAHSASYARRSHNSENTAPTPKELAQQKAIMKVYRKYQQREYERIEHPALFPSDYFFRALAELVLDD